MRLLVLICCPLFFSSLALATELPGNASSGPVQIVPDNSTFFVSPPVIAARFHESGTVLVNVLLDRGGNVQNLGIATSSGFPQLDSDAILEAQSLLIPRTDKDGPDLVWKQIKFIYPPISDNPPDRVPPWPDDAPLLTGKPPPPGYVVTKTPSISSLHSIAGYPPLARRLHQMGTLELEYVVGPDGWIENDRIVRSSGYPLLDAEALISVGFWNYAPVTKDGAPTRVRGIVNLTFKFND